MTFSSDPRPASRPRTFRVATEGATCDGLALSRARIEQMAKNYDPRLYGARVNLEHYRGILPDGPFRAYGDVIALSTREVQDGRLALYTTIDLPPDLVALWRARQKIYMSIEIEPKFADTGEADLMGLAVTDSPAPLGCEMLKFAAGAQVNPLAPPKTAPGTLFAKAEPVEMAFDADAPADATAPDTPSLLERVRGLLSRKERTDAAALADVHTAVRLVAEQTDQTVADVERAARASVLTP
ncbi:GPO family capsid scaffolding protein [Phaeovibrio sulfidiphilus]|uniref:GPO family capsid scaffolding protein n=1 Tax=Phaeovibrio sulfidiphilus TaxID=1220600 RepID=A0A8J6YQJ0_9PROT|nr:GPO family capsid scaffolding protein [Phaeovibrio sulfidiphilus]MBE1237871.1 GPO family capsid scaffolding protein [Phaeovibrio sulfidiphilus]